MKKQLFATLISVITTAACIFPNGAMATPQDFYNLQIRAVITGWGNEGIYLNTTNSSLSIDGCGPNFMVPVSHPMFNQILSMALTGYTASATVVLHVDGCFNSGNMNLKAIQLVK